MTPQHAFALAALCFLALVAYYHHESRAHFMFLGSGGKVNKMKVFRYAFVISAGIGCMAYSLTQRHHPNSIHALAFEAFLIALFVVCKIRENHTYSRERAVIEGTYWAALWAIAAVYVMELIHMY